MSKDTRVFTEEQKHSFFKPIQHRQKRRAWWHDYTSRNYYMVTVKTSHQMPPLSNVIGNLTYPTDYPRVEPTLIGRIIFDALKITKQQFSNFQVHGLAIMPDHIHLIIYIAENNSPHLGKIIGYFMGRCTVLLHQQFPLLSEVKYFEPGFHDWIVSRHGQLGNFIRYVKDNPRRLMIKRTYPDLFRTKKMLIVNGVQMASKGNAFLLRHPLRIQVRFSSKLKPEEWEARCDHYNRIIAQGGVLISPFIHPNEKMIMKRAIENGASIILLVDNGFRERQAPTGALFDLCAAGRALIIAPSAYNPEKKSIKREECLQLNSWARLFAEQDPQFFLRPNSTNPS